MKKNTISYGAVGFLLGVPVAFIFGSAIANSFYSAVWFKWVCILIILLGSIFPFAWYGYRRDKKEVNTPVGSQEGLTKNEKILIWSLSIFGSVLVGAVAYYVWKKNYPKKAQSANLISWFVFVVELALVVGIPLLLMKIQKT